MPDDTTSGIFLINIPVHYFVVVSYHNILEKTTIVFILLMGVICQK